MTASTSNLERLPRLELESVIGFGGGVTNGLHLHPDGMHLLYTLGACVVIREIGNPRAAGFLHGHNDKISCLAISKSGRYVASGQQTHMGFQADICVFDFATRKLIHRMLLHKVHVQALAFSPDETLLASVGGKDDKSLVIWDLQTGRPLCGGPASTEMTNCVSFFNNSSTTVITGGVAGMRVWDIDMQMHKLILTEVNLGNLRREITSIGVEAADRYAYCGTGSGDVLCIQLQGSKVFKMSGPKKRLASGVHSSLITSTGDVLVGGGAGTVYLLSKIDLTILKETQVEGAVTSCSSIGQHYFVGTNRSNVYYINGRNFHEELRQTCHYDAINDIAFPYNYSELFATCCANDIRIWNANTSAELLRIQVGTLECNAVQFTMNGKIIVAGWSDGKVRAFGPQSGKLIYAINDAHKVQGMKRLSGRHTGVTAICVDHANERLISGGADSQVRVWRIQDQTYTLEASMKEHKATVNSIVLNKADTECVSASDDGSCIVWDLIRGARRNIMYSQTYFKAANYFVDESQLLTTGSDRLITYWDSIDCQAIREIEASKSGEINGLDISQDGSFFTTGGSDRMVKIWGYDTGALAAYGVGHSCAITKVRIAPDGRHIVSVGEEGAIMIWKVGELEIEQL